jgi:talin
LQQDIQLVIFFSFLQVASAAAHLLVACKVKADANSKAMQRLQAAGNAVKVGTEHYILAAKKAVGAEDERTLTISQRLVSGIAQVSFRFEFYFQ